MSHIVSIKTEIRDAAAVQAACRRLGLPEPVHRTVKLYSSKATGLAVQLPDWQYPIVCDTASGQIKYDNFRGHWGKQTELDKFLQMYLVEKGKLEARKAGHSATEQQLADGWIKVSIHVAGGAA